MSIVTDNLGVLRGGRQLIQDAGVTNRAIVIRTRTWSGGQTGKGTATDSDLSILPNPTVTELGDGSYRIEDITPAYSGGGYRAEQLFPATPSNGEVYVVMTGPDAFARECRIIDHSFSDPFSYVLIVKDRK